MAGLLTFAQSSHAGTIAFWTFEGDGTNTPTSGTYIKDTDGRTVPPTANGILVRDISGNGNSLFTWDDNATGHQYQDHISGNTVPQTGQPNQFSILNSGNFPATFTWSSMSAPLVDVETIEPLQWTLEASIYQTAFSANSTFVGRDGNGETNVTGFASTRAPLYFCTVNGLLQISFTDAAGNNYDLQDPTGAISLNQWYNVAAVSDGTTLSLYRDSGSGYVLVNSMALTPGDTRLNYDSDGSSSPGDPQWGWTFGRGRSATTDGQTEGHTSRFFGYIDNVRISDVALTPAQFLGFSTNVYVISGPNPGSLTVPSGSPASFSVTVGGDAPIYYQWRHNGTNISGANSATFNIASATIVNSGNYDVIITNNYSAVTSSVATLTIHNPRILTWGGVAGAWDSTTANWTTNNSGSFVSYVETDNVRFDPLGIAQPVVNLTSHHIPSSVVVSNATYTFAGSSMTNGAAPLTIQNNAALTLQMSNRFGALSLESGSRLTVNANQTLGGLSGGGLLSSTSGAPVIIFGNNNLNTTWSGSITNEGGSISFIKVGTGTTTVTSPNYFAGTAANQVNGGGIVLSASGSIIPRSTAELWVAEGANTGYVEVNGGSVTVSNWLVIGRNNAAANGTMVVNGGTVTKAGAGNIAVGSLGATGTLIINGGVVSNNANVWLGENAGANATLRLNGGLLQATQIRVNGTGIATSQAYFNGGVLQAMTSSADFIPSPVTLLVQSGGLIFDDNGFNITINNQLNEDFLTPSPGGGLTKLGSGTLTLTGTGYSGPTVVRAGTLHLDPSIGSYSQSANLVVSNATLSIAAGLGSVSSANVSLGNNAVLNLNYGTVTANPVSAAIAATGSLTAPGATITINISALGLQVGTIPLITYTGATLGSIANFVLGPLPPGVTANLANNPNSLDLVITATGQNLSWYGDVNNVWNINGTANWQNSGVPGAKYLEYGPTGDPVRFDDTAVGSFDVNLTESVHPFKVTVDAGNNYSITGAGSITGSTLIEKLNVGTLTLGTANSHSGGTLISGGTVVVSSNSPLGAASASVILAGGNLQLLNNTSLGSRPVVVTNASTISVPLGTTASIGGNISGNGALSKVDDGTLNVTGSNTITGAFHVNQGTVNFSGTNLASSVTPALMNIGSTLGSGTLNLLPGAVMRRFEVKLGNATGVKGTLNMTNATLTTGAEIWVGGSVDNIQTEGEFNLVGGSVIASNWTAVGRSFGASGNSKGVLNIIGGTWTNRGANNFVVCSAANNLGIVNVTSAGVLAAGVPAVNANQMWVGEGGNGILNINNASVYAFRAGNPALVVGRAGGGAGSIRLNSGLLYSADQTYLGHGTGTAGSYGELSQIGGTAISRFYFIVARGNDRAIFRQSGGEFFITNRFMTIGAGAGSIGIADIAGGTFTSVGADDIVNNTANSSGIYVGEGGTAVLNIRGNAAVNLLGINNVGGLRIGSSAASYGIVNLNGGVIAAQRVAKGNAAASAFLNFNGGTLRANSDFAVFMAGLNEANVLAGGAVIDDAGFSIGIDQPLIAPAGNGVTSIAIADGGSGYIGAPIVVISGGTGTNATAVANMMPDGSPNGTLKIASLTITSPGNYSVAPTTVSFLGGGQNAVAATVGAITTAANVSGGLTKTGPGVTTLSGTNTYTGLTTVSNGTLRVNGSVTGAVTVKSGARLGGNGAISGIVTVESGGTLGSSTNLGTLTLGSSPVLASGSTVVAKLNRNDGVTTQADRINVTGALSFNGTLVLTNTGGPLQVGDTFTLFGATGGYSGSFSIVSQSPFQAVTWNTSNLAVDGTITVASATSVTPTLVPTVTGNTLGLSWSPLGMRLETNAVGLTATGFWFTYPGSASVTNVSLPIDLSATNVFFRLVYP